MRVILWLGLAALAALGQVKYEDIVAGPGANWLTYAGSYSGQRHSPLTQINTETAKNLTAKWVYHVPDAKKLEAVPIVYDGIMYVTNSNQLHALDARTGRRIWVYRDEQAEGSLPPGRPAPKDRRGALAQEVRRYQRGLLCHHGAVRREGQDRGGHGRRR